jgi:flagellar basal-body rod modification protein FlgD
MTTHPTTSATVPTMSTPASATTQALAQQTASLGEDAFMQLLVTQLKNQDPTQPQDSSQFVTQLAQFSSLEKLTTMNQSLTTLASINSSLTNISQTLSQLGAATPPADPGGTTSTTSS